jgi:Ca-activated chloride channel family protein
MNRTIAIFSGASFLSAAILFVAFGPKLQPSWWFTPAQQADRLFQQKKFAAAEKASGDPARQGAALFRAGDFKAAATAFARDGSATGAFNRGNALVMQGKYDAAIKSYDRALSLKSAWKEAEDNRAVAVVRGDRLTTEGGDVTGGQVKADKIVFGKGKNKPGETVQVDGGEPLSDEQFQAMWLRQVQTKPADFLRAKFAFQLEDQTAEGSK